MTTRAAVSLWTLAVAFACVVVYAAEHLGEVGLMLLAIVLGTLALVSARAADRGAL